jgi:acylphosphatase
MSDETSCRRVIYHGRVQGVGFRFTAHRIAQQHPVRGFVRNLRDGTVELVAAGSESAVRRFLGEMLDAMRANITAADESDWPTPLDSTGFEIRRH